MLHFVGHGDFTADGDGVLYLEDAERGHAAVDSTELANLLADQTSLRLVVLNSCEGARTTLTDPFAGVATTLVQLGVPAVVAMQFEISDAAAILFAEELYTNLIGRQDPIDAAVAEARKAIYIELGTVEWATPVLFMGDTDVTLFRFAAMAAPLPPPPPADVAPPPAPAAPSPRPPVAPDRRTRRRPAGRALVGLAALVVAGLVVFALVRRGDDDGGAGADSTTSTAARSPESTGPPGPTSTGAAAAAVTPVAAQRFTGEITAADESVPYPVDLAAGQLVYVDGASECGAQVAYKLVSPSGVQAGGLPYVCTDLGRVRIGETGRWTLVVESYGGGTGAYDVGVAPIPADVVEDVVMGQQLAGEVTQPGEHHLYRFSAGAAEVVYVDAGGACNSVAYQILPPGGGAPLAGLPYACGDTDRTVLPATGEYTVSVESYQGGIGAYDLTLLAVPADVSTPIERGDPVQGEITSPGQRMRYPFTAAANDVVAVDARGPCGASVAYFVESPSGLQVGGLPYVCNDLEPQVLAETGTFALVVESYAGGVGAYDLLLHPVS